MDSEIGRYNGQNGNSKWDTLREALVTSAIMDLDSSNMSLLGSFEEYSSAFSILNSISSNSKSNTIKINEYIQEFFINKFVH